MICNLRVRNFKAWADTDEIKLAPITVLFGSSSSGKSSIAQLLMLLKQSVTLEQKAANIEPNCRDGLELDIA